MINRFVIGLFSLLIFCSCQNENVNNDRIIATVYDKTLYQSDLQSILYEGISYNDSLVATKAFVENWIRRQLMIHYAENNIDKAELDFSKQMEDYRNSLIIYKFETMLYEQKLDTVVTEEDIEKYLKENTTIDMEKEAVRYIILNMRKKELVDKMYTSLYNKAVKERVFEIY